MAIALFHPSHLNNVQSLREGLLSGEEEIAKLDSLPVSAYQKSEDFLYHSSFDVITTLGALPARIVYSVFLRSISTLLSCVYFDGMAKAIQFGAQLGEVYSDSIFRQLYWGSQRIIPTFNIHAPSARYITEFKSIQRENIQDSLIRKNLTPLFSKVTFDFGNQGLCSGSVNWFNYLFLLGIYKQTQLSENCETYRQYMTAISHLFKDGQPVQAALLQSLYGADAPLLGIQEKNFSIEHHRLQSFSTLLESLQYLPNGLFHMRVKGVHSISVLKVQDELLAFDPNSGLINLKKLDDLATLIESYLPKQGQRLVVFSYQELKKPNVLTRIQNWIKS